jgi:hypothetical protein
MSNGKGDGDSKECVVGQGTGFYFNANKIERQQGPSNYLK